MLGNEALDSNNLMVRAGFRGGFQNGYLNNQSISAANTVTKENADNIYAADTQAYDVAYGNFKTQKDAYLQSKNLPPETSDYAYSIATNNNPPPKPTYAQPTYQQNMVKSDYVYGFFSGGVSYSKIINKNQLLSAQYTGKKALPLRMGLEFNWNIPLYDGLQKPPAGVTYDFNKNNNSMANVKVLFIF